MIKRILAGSLAALTAGATLAFGAVAIDNFGDYVQVSDSTLASPVIVIGDTAQVIDVLGAADIAAGVAGYATTTVTVGASAATTVSDGVDLSTAGTRLYLNDSLNKATTTITSTSMPTVLASGSVIDASGVTYAFSQFILPGSGSRQIAYGRSSSENMDPKIYVDTGAGTSIANTNPLYTSRVTFGRAINFTSADVRGQTITLFGKEYTIGSSSTNTDIILFGGADEETIEAGETKTVTVGGVEHEVSLVMTESSTSAALSVDGVTRTVTEGASTLFGSGTNMVTVYTKYVFHSGVSGGSSSVVVQIGADQLRIRNAQAVAKGTSDTSIQGTYATITQQGGSTSNHAVSQISIGVAAVNAIGDYIAESASFTDPVFGSFRVAFGGAAPALKDTTDATISVLGSNIQSTARLTAKGGYTQTMQWAYDADGGTTGVITGRLGDSTNRIAVAEAMYIPLQGYVVLSQGDFSHLYQLTSTTTNTSSNKVTLLDVFSGTSLDLSLGADIGSTQEANATNGASIDGQTYYVVANSTGACFTWGTSAFASSMSSCVGRGSPAPVGTSHDVFPIIHGVNGEAYAFLSNHSTAIGTLGNGTSLTVPGGNAASGRSNLTAAAAGVTTADVGQLTYIYNSSTDGNMYLVSVEGVPLNNPTLLVLEPRSRDTSSPESEVRHGLLITTEADSTNMAVATTVTDSDAVSSSTTWYTSEGTKASQLTRYGTLVETDSTGQNTVNLWIPSDQRVMSVAIGADPSFTVASEGTSVEQAVRITAPVSKFASEVDSDALEADLILVGGPCVNTLVADLLGEDEQCDVWPYETGIIKEVTDAFGSGHSALIVAGTTGDDTRSLAAQVLQGTFSFEE